MLQRGETSWNSKGIHREPSLTIKMPLALLLALGFAPALACQQDSTPRRETIVTPYADKDAYSIYAILLERAKSSVYVIQAETESWSGATPKKLGITGGRDFQKIWKVAVKDFANQYRNPRVLTRDIPIRTLYELVPEQQLLSIFKSGGGWDTFYHRYPSSGGFFSFSAVGFDSQRTHAVVKMHFGCGSLCGYSKPHFFVKKDGQWREVCLNANVTTWVS